MKNASKIRILYIEDETVLCELFTGAVTSHGYAVDIARTGKDGLALQSENSYNLIAIDYQLAGRSGLDIARKLLVDNPDLPLLIIAEPGNKCIAAEVLTFGIASYVVKDDDLIFPDLIPTLIAHLLDRSRRRIKQAETEKALRDRDTKIAEDTKHQRIAFDNSPYGVAIVPLDDPTKRLYVNQRLVEIMGRGLWTNCFPCRPKTPTCMNLICTLLWMVRRAINL